MSLKSIGGYLLMICIIMVGIFAVKYLAGKFASGTIIDTVANGV